MGGINLGRVLVGGLLAGVVINIGEYVLNEIILVEQWVAVSERFDLPALGAGTILFFIIWGFVMGIAMVWLYAAIRPRYGAGVSTAICAGLCAWFFTWVMGFAAGNIMGLFPSGLVLTAVIWGAIEAMLATSVGAWLYTE